MCILMIPSQSWMSALPRGTEDPLSMLAPEQVKSVLLLHLTSSEE